MSHAAWHSKTPYGTGSADTTQVQFYPSNHGETLTIAKGFWAPLSGHGLCIPKMPWSQRWALRMPNKGYCWVWEGRLYSWARWGLFDLTTFHQDRFGKICQLSVVEEAITRDHQNFIWIFTHQSTSSKLLESSTPFQLYQMEDYGASDRWWVSPWWNRWQCNVSIYPNFSRPYRCAHFRITPITWQIVLSKSCVNGSSLELLIIWVGYSLKNSRKYLKWWLSLLQQQ